MKTEAEIGVICLQVKNIKDYQNLLEAKRETWNRFFLKTSEKDFILNFWPPEYLSVVLSYPVCLALLQ